jgi:MFS family permease
MEFFPSMWNTQFMTEGNLPAIQVQGTPPGKLPGDPHSTPQGTTPKLGVAFWRLWTSAGLSDLADGVVKVALPLVAIGFTRSPALIAGLGFAFTLPWLLFALPAGMFADRLDRRRAMLGANCVRASLLLVLVVFVAAGGRSIAALYAAAFCVGTAETLYDTSAQSIISQIVQRSQLSRANARLYGVQLTANQFIGPPAAGLLVAGGAVAAFATPVGLWLVALGALLLVRGSFRVPRERSAGMRAEILEGLRFVWQNQVLRTFAVMVGVFNFATSGVFAVFVLYAVGRTSAMGLSKPAYGLLLTMIPIGSVLGSLVAERAELRLGKARTLALSFLAGALLVGIPAMTTSPYVIGVAFFLGGIGIVISNVVMVSLRQRMTPDRMLGRVNSCYRLVAWGTMPLGTAVAGLLGEMIGLRAMFAAMGVVALTTLIGLLVASDSAMEAAIDSATDAAIDSAESAI